MSEPPTLSAALLQEAKVGLFRLWARELLPALRGHLPQGGRQRPLRRGHLIRLCPRVRSGKSTFPIRGRAPAGAGLRSDLGQQARIVTRFSRVVMLPTGIIFQTPWRKPGVFVAEGSGSVIGLEIRTATADEQKAAFLYKAFSNAL